MDFNDVTHHLFDFDVKNSGLNTDCKNKIIEDYLTSSKYEWIKKYPSVTSTYGNTT